MTRFNAGFSYDNNVVCRLRTTFCFRLSGFQFSIFPAKKVHFDAARFCKALSSLGKIKK